MEQQLFKADMDMPWGKALGGGFGHAALLSKLSRRGTWGHGTAKPLTSHPPTAAGAGLAGHAEHFWQPHNCF